MLVTHLFLIEENEAVNTFVLLFFIGCLCLMILYYILKIIELGYVLRYKRPCYVHVPFFLKTLNDKQLFILKHQFSFYKKLKPKHQRYFEHRVASFIGDKKFIGREGLQVTDEMKILVSATATMLTFGFRNFHIRLISTIFIYPDVFYSKMNDDYHKGEFNPKLQALVLSWKDFKNGFEIKNDNINLGIHEFAHAIHLNSIKDKDISSTIFTDAFKELTSMLSENETLRKKLIASDYFRDYAYTNQYEFLAVIIESFIETPVQFKEQFPVIYAKTKQMLNFNFAGY